MRILQSVCIYTIKCLSNFDTFVVCGKKEMGSRFAITIINIIAINFTWAKACSQALNNKLDLEPLFFSGENHWAGDIQKIWNKPFIIASQFQKLLHPLFGLGSWAGH